MTSEPFCEGRRSPPTTDFSTVRDANKRTGLGFFLYPNGSIYEGEWLCGERHGLGVCYYDSGNIFVGQFRQGNMEGEGTMLFKSGQFFIGEFKDSAIHRGVFSSRGREVRGVWEDGERVASYPETLVPLEEAHAMLFSSIIKQVHAHFRPYAQDPNAFPPVLQTVGSSMIPPTDISSSDNCTHLTAVNSTHTKKRGSAGTALPLLEILNTISSNSGRASLEHPTAVKRGGDLRTVLTPPVSTKTVFVCAAPARTEHFSFFRFGMRLVVFTLPFVSLPYCPVRLLQISPLEEEREYVVSGATLQRSFDYPKWTLYIIAVSMMCQIASIGIVACKVSLGRAQEGHLTLSEMVIPCVLWLIVALFCAAFYSYVHVPHYLERLDRELVPKLSAHAASAIDARSKLCIYTWDEEGRGKVVNMHYQYRWILFAIVYGAMMSLSAPATRGGFGHRMFGSGFQAAATLLAFFATFFLSATLTYYVMQITDMQREVSAKMHVLSKISYLEQRSITNPSTHLRQTFDLGEKFNPSDVFRGLPGWYVARSLILYASNSSKHASRSGAMSVFALSMFSAYLVVISDALYMVSKDETRSATYYSTAHSYGLVVFVFWGTLFLRYLFACAMTNKEFQQHLYIMDTTSLYHLVQAQDREASETVKQCRGMMAAHDIRPEVFGFAWTPLLSVFVIYLNLVAVIAIAFVLGQAIRY